VGSLPPAALPEPPSGRNTPKVAGRFSTFIPSPAGALSMNPYVLLGAAIASELLGTTALKLSEGFSNPVPSLGVVLGYGAAFYLVSLTLEELPIGVVYGTWAALGIVGVAAIGTVVFDEPVDPVGVVGIALIVAGVYCLNVLSSMAAH
jgi:small multidrug resistance pump